jgi:hypothetical protein
MLKILESTAIPGTILALARFWGLQVTNIDTRKRLTSAALKLGITSKSMRILISTQIAGLLKNF